MLLKNKLFLLIFSILMLNTLSAAGLSVSELNYSHTKYKDSDTTFVFKLTNNNNFPMYNISLDSNNLISIPTISYMNASSSAIINGVIFSNNSFNNSFKIKGTYFTNVGTSNQTHQVYVNFNTGQSICDFTSIIGDKVTFVNQVNDAITLRNANTNLDVVNIPVNGNYTMNLDYENSFRYYFLRVGYPFGKTCTITTLPTTGYVNNPEYDAEFNMNVNISFYPTNVEYTLFENNFSIAPLGSEEGILLIKNVGSYDAENVALTGDWFEFNENNFQLKTNKSKAVTYTIKPITIYTNETNKTYQKTLYINGNFGEIKLNFSIFVPYRNLDNYANTSNYDSFFETINAYCLTHPDITWCNDKIFTGIINNTGDNFNVTFSEEQVKGIFEKIFEMSDEMSINNNYLKEKIDILEQNLSMVNNNTQIMQDYTIETKQNNTLLIVLFLIIGILLAAGSTVIFLILKNKEDKKDDSSKWG